MQIVIKASKTDPLRKGVTVHLERTSNLWCPVVALAAYLAIRGSAKGPFFRLQSGALLTRPYFVNRVTRALATNGIDSTKYSGHSFRIGAASTAAARGVEDSLIQTLGRWKSNSYLLYVRIPRERLALITPLLAKHDR